MPATSRIICLTLILMLAACAPRGSLVIDPKAEGIGASRDVFVATTRAAAPGVGQFSSDRGRGASYGKYRVSIPPEHETGEIEWPRRRPDAVQHFVTSDAESYSGPAAFRAALGRAIANLPRGERGAVIYVHGFNNNFAEGLYRIAQLGHDYKVPGVAVHFSWPSAGHPLGYAYDRDSVITARDGFEALLRDVAAAGANEILIVAHSMGSYLMMETLRQMAIARDNSLRNRVSGVVLISPDIDIDVFRAQAARIGQLPQPFVIFSSERDRALRLSARLTGQRDRLGNVTDAAEVADLEVTLIDVTDFAERGGLNHFTALNSPAIIALFSGLPQLAATFNRDASVRTGLFPGTVLTVQNATEIILTPLSQ